MTAEEKLTIIRKKAEDLYLYLYKVYYSYYGSVGYEKYHWAKEQLEWIDKVIAEDAEEVSSDTHMDADVAAEARKKASHIDYSLIRCRDDIYIKGFKDGQWWRQQNPKK